MHYIVRKASLSLIHDTPFGKYYYSENAQKFVELLRKKQEISK
jgi:hypothetical protein